MNYKEKYDRFIKSDWWKYIRDKKVKSAGKCFICGNRYSLNLHHAGYKNLWKGKKSDALKDTFVLCRDCHMTVHIIQKEQGLNYEKTKEIIYDLKNELKNFSPNINNHNQEFYEMCKNF